MFDLTDRVAIVTGGGKGIGARAARVLAGAGADVVVGGRHQDILDAVAVDVRALGRRALAVPADMRRVADVRALVSQTLDVFGRVDILVNNAGVNRTGPALEVSEETWVLAKQPSGRVGEVEDLDGTILFLASAASDYVNGQMIFVDGASSTGWMGPE
jgi:NAD(P)-dependent dehydrogenase (short-subunit alcohol dehydrogenase family)